MQQCLIGVDVGTMGTKSAIFDIDGTLLAESFEPSRLIHPRPDWVEQDADEMVDSVFNTIAHCMTKSKLDADAITGISIDGQMAGILGIGPDGRAVTRYDSWLDARCKPYVEQMDHCCGSLVHERTGCPPMLAHGPKILWWKHEEPETYKRIHKFVQPGAYAAMRLAGLAGKDAFVDHTYIHFSGFCDTQQRRWDEELCSRFEVDIQKLPRIVSPSEIIGTVSSEPASRCKLKPGTPIVAGCGDTCASYVGTGVVVPGRFLDVAGTASVLAACTDRYRIDTANRIFLLSRSISDKVWHPLAYINGGGLNLKWFRDQFANRRLPKESQLDYDELDEEATTVPAGSDNLIFVPHLGGRVCPSQPAIRGTWVGFSWGHTQPHFYRSLLEAVAYEYRYYLDSYREMYPDMALGEVRVIGGGAKSRLWNQIKSDVLGVPYVTLNREEGATLGSAILAGVGVGLYRDIVSVTQKIIKETERFEPDKDRNQQYQERYALYKQIIHDLEGVYGKIHAT